MRALIILLIFLTSSLLLAQEDGKQGEDEVVYEVVPNSLPQEFSLLFNNYWTSSFYSQLQNNQQKSMNWLRRLDWNFQQIPKEYLFRMCRTEVEKYILSLNGDVKAPTFFSKQLLVDFQKHIATNEKFMSPFEKAMSIGLYKDYEELLSSSFFPTLQTQLREFKSITDPDLIFLKKKISNVAEVMTYLMSIENVEREGVIKSATTHIMNNIFNKVKAFNQLSTIGIAPPPKKLHFFRIRPKPEDLSKVVDQTLAELDKKKKKPEIVKINWDELPLIPTPIPGYKPPKELPKPLNDWISKIPSNEATDNLFAIPTPDPNYKAPNKLPTPLGPPGVWPEE